MFNNLSVSVMDKGLGRDRSFSRNPLATGLFLLDMILIDFRYSYDERSALVFRETVVLALLTFDSSSNHF